MQKVFLSLTDPSLRAWLTGILMNHNTAILFDKQEVLFFLSCSDRRVD